MASLSFVPCKRTAFMRDPGPVMGPCRHFPIRPFQVNLTTFVKLSRAPLVGRSRKEVPGSDFRRGNVLQQDYSPNKVLLSPARDCSGLRPRDKASRTSRWNAPGERLSPSLRLRPRVWHLTSSIGLDGGLVTRKLTHPLAHFWLRLVDR